MTIDEKYERELVRSQQALESAIEKLYINFAHQIAPLIRSGMALAALERAINLKLTQLTKSIHAEVAGAIQYAWQLSNSKTGAYLDKRLKGYMDELPDGLKKVWYDPNKGALEQFLKRKSNGVTLSKRVFKQTRQAKAIISRQLKDGIGTGTSTVKIARLLRDQLTNPTGSPAPGQGVYKSPVANTKRLARTETNRSYRMADHEAWKKNPIILGYNIELSKTQSKKVKARCEICKALAGPYPVSFIFTGFHPNCLCYKTPILMNDKQMAAYTALVAAGEYSLGAIDKVRKMRGGGLVNEVPSGFNKWVTANKKRVEGWAKVPEWWKVNEEVVASVLNVK